MNGSRRSPSSPLQGGARGVGYVVVAGITVMLAGWAIAAALTWVVT